MRLLARLVAKFSLEGKVVGWWHTRRASADLSIFNRIFTRPVPILRWGTLFLVTLIAQGHALSFPLGSFSLKQGGLYPKRNGAQVLENSL